MVVGAILDFEITVAISLLFDRSSPNLEKDSDFDLEYIYYIENALLPKFKMKDKIEDVI